MLHRPPRAQAGGESAGGAQAGDAASHAAAAEALADVCEALGLTMETTSEEEAYLWEDDYLDVVADGEQEEAEKPGRGFLAEVASRGEWAGGSVCCVRANSRLLQPRRARCATRARSVRAGETAWRRRLELSCCVFWPHDLPFN